LHQARTSPATWQDSRDTSRVWAQPIGSFVDPAFVAPGAIAWLLLQRLSVEAGPAGRDALTRTTYIQRINTIGGVAPATGCTAAGNVGAKILVPYEADYTFYKPRHGEDNN
jgi:lipid-binding SYLF domain-containing protein